LLFDFLPKQSNMCLAIPGKIKSIEYQYDGLVKMAKVQFGGITKEASLEMLPAAKEGDYVLVHVGVAISIVDEEEAMLTFKYLEEIGEIDELIESSQLDRNSLGGSDY
jgi:hydrogenase expression/formation protein HypC